MVSLVLPGRVPTEVEDSRPVSFSPGAFIILDAEGIVTIRVGKSEMGQGVLTALPMIVAEEMGADWEKVRVEHAPLGEEFGLQVTGGSASVSSSWEMLRNAGATAREMLVLAAARQWNVEPASCRAE